MERPGIHVIVKISEIWILRYGFVKRFPIHAHADRFHQRGFSDTDIPSHCHKFFHLWNFSRQFLVYYLLENIQRLRAHKGNPVDEESGRGTDTQVYCKIAICFDGGLKLMLCNAIHKRWNVHPQFARILFIDRVAQCLPAEQLFMKLPEYILITGAHGCLCSREGIGVYGSQRQVSIHNPDLSRVGSQQRLIGLIMPAAAEWTLEIAELNERDRSVCGTKGIETFSWNIPTSVLSLHRRFNNRTIGLPGGLRALYGAYSVSCSPYHIAHKDSCRECKNCQRGVKVTALKCDGIFLLHHRFIMIGRFRDRFNCILSGRHKRHYNMPEKLTCCYFCNECAYKKVTVICKMTVA